MSTPVRKRNEKLFKAFYCFSHVDLDTSIRTLAKYKVPNDVSNKSASSHSETDPVEDSAVALLCLPEGVHQIHERSQKPSTQFHTFVITQETGNRLYGGALQVWMPMDKCKEHTNSSSIFCYQVKALCLLTAVPLVYSCKRLLQLLNAHNYSIELVQLICSVPIPSSDRFLRLRLPHNDVFPQNPLELLLCGDMGSLPAFDYPLQYLFSQVIPPPDFMRLFTALLLEQRILITSKSYLLLMLMAESLTCLLKPFSWQHVYVPILPTQLGLHYLDAPTPYIMGVVLNSDSMQPHESPSTTTSVAHYHVDCDRHSVFSQQKNSDELNKQKKSLKGENDENNQNCNILNDKTGEKENPLVVPDFLQELTQALQHILTTWTSACGCKDSIWPALDQKALNKCAGSCIHSLEEQRFNHTVRMLFLHQLHRHLLHNHERFVQLGRNESIKFDAVSFLCDQPVVNHIFLSQFLQTQMFASFLDESGKQLQARIAQSSNICGDSLCIVDTDEFTIDKDNQLLQLDTKHLQFAFSEAKLIDLSASNVNSENSSLICANNISNLASNQRKKSSNALNSPFKICMSPIRTARQKNIQNIPNDKQQSVNDIEPADAFAAQTNWRIVASLLKEVKVKTKRIVLDCMKDEELNAIGAYTIAEQERQNAQIAALCDLLQRIWSHSRTNEMAQARCPFWHHLTFYVNSLPLNTFNETTLLNNKRQESLGAIGWMKKQFDALSDSRGTLSPLSSPFRSLMRSSPMHTKTMNSSVFISSTYTSSPNATPTAPASTVRQDYHSILSLTDITTEVGRSRAFIRLALERGLLSSHLRTLLSCRPLLVRFYKKYAFLYAEEEREQFLTHLLTLSTVHLRSFSLLYGSCSLRHRLFFYGSGGFAGQVQLTSRNSLSTTETGACKTISLQLAQPSRQEHLFYAPAQLQPLCMSLKVNNLSRLYLNNVFLLNDVTGDAYQFKCDFWFGKLVDDSSCERIVIAKPIKAELIGEIIRKCNANRGFSIGRHWSKPNDQLDDLPASNQLADWLGRSVNLLCRHCLSQSLALKSKKQALSSLEDGPSSLDMPKMASVISSSNTLLNLLLEDKQIIWTFLRILKDGFRSKSSHYTFRTAERTWDFFQRMQRELQEPRAEQDDPRTKTIQLCTIIEQVHIHASQMSKDDKTRILLLVCLRDHLLLHLFECIFKSRFLSNYYEPNSFICVSKNQEFLKQVLIPLNDIQLQLISELTKGV